MSPHYKISNNFGSYESKSGLDKLLLKIPEEKINNLKKFIKESFESLFKEEYQTMEFDLNNTEIKEGIDFKLRSIKIEFSSEYPTLLKRITGLRRNETLMYLSHTPHFRLEDYIKGIKIDTLTYYIDNLPSAIYKGKKGSLIESEKVQEILKLTLKKYFEIFEAYDAQLTNN